MPAKRTKPETKTPKKRYALLIVYDRCPEPDIEGPFDSIAAVLNVVDEHGYDADFEGYLGILTPDYKLLKLELQHKWVVVTDPELSATERNNE